MIHKKSCIMVQSDLNEWIDFVIVLENENGLETVKGGNIIFISLKED